jgi:hypothetical protein
LEAILEDDKPVETRQQRLEDIPTSVLQVAQGAGQNQVEVPMGREGQQNVRDNADEHLRDAFGWMAISPDQHERPGPHKILPPSSQERTPPKLGPQESFPHLLARGGPPSEHTRQMKEDLEKTLLKRYDEAKALEKKKKKDIKKEKQ